MKHSSSRILLPLQVPDSVPIPWDYPQAILRGVGIAAIANGLFISIEAYSGMAVGDIIEVYWDESGVPFATTVISSAELNQRIGIKLPEDRFTPGDFTPYYRLRRTSSVEEESEKVNYRVMLTHPGGEDPQPNTPNMNENLAAPQVPPEIETGGVGSEAAAAGVSVTIPPYTNMAEYDHIIFSWGGQQKSHTVQPNEVAQNIILHVMEEEILAAGDGDIFLMYQIFDAASNRSDGWSMPTIVSVFAGDAVLEAPLVKEAEGMVLNLDALGGNDATIQVMVTAPDFESGDIIHLSWDGHTISGSRVDWFNSRNVTTVPRVEEINVPYNIVAAIAQGYAVIYYELQKDGSNVLYSERTTVQVEGAVQQLEAPTVDEAEGNILSADLQSATVRVQPYTGMAAGDFIELIWAGTRSGGQPTDYRDSLFVSGNSVGKVITFIVPKEQIGILDGGSVDIYYTVEAGIRATVQESHHLTLQVGSEEATLPAPNVREASNGVLPSETTVATVEILPYDAMASGDRIDLFWDGDVTGKFEDWLPVSTSMVGKTVSFHVDGAEISPNTTADVSYSVARTEGTTDMSAILSLQIGDQTLLLPAPSVDEANDNQLLLEDIPNGATTRINSYLEMAAGDVVTLIWEGNGNSYTDSYPISSGSVGNDVLFNVPYVEVENYVNNEVDISYRVEQISGSVNYSEVLTLNITEEQKLLPAPVVNEAEAEIIYPENNPNGVTVTVPTEAELNAGDTIIIHWEGQPGAGTTEITKLVTTTGQSLTIDISNEVVLANEGNNVYVSYQVTRVANGIIEYSDTATYFVAFVTSERKLVVLGARKVKCYRYGPHIQKGYLRAIAQDTQNDMEVSWQYVGTSTSKTGNIFLDTNPDLPLRVFNDEEEVIINPANLFGNGDAPVENATGAFVARLDSGYLVTWGTSNAGGSLPPQFGETTVTTVTAGCASFAAITTSGNIVAWGNDMYTTPPASIYDVTEISASGFRDTEGAYAALRSTGDVVSWGNISWGGDSWDTNVSQLTHVVGGAKNMVAIRYSNQPHLEVWGNGSALPAPSAISDLSWFEVVASGGYTEFGVMQESAYAAWSSGGQVRTWGMSALGGDGGIIEGVIDLTSNGYGFLARKTDSSVIAWGDPLRGGTVPSSVSGLRDIIGIYSTFDAFAVLRATGNVFAWGDPQFGGSVPSPISQLTDIVQVCGTAHAFAALRKNGDVVAWGDSQHGGDISTVQNELYDIRAIYAGAYAFAALRADGRVVTWGLSNCGGDNNAVLNQLNGNIFYEEKYSKKK
ncbi:RCC1 domain-containing protein [Citrobacter koseri]|uniref:RCC1 domain-containing protein n=1 Tax=Citrobacter koseri TaxID=545 RepID=UPI0023B1A0D8|nr:hypothetical protein [Citrobacter koseri]